MYVLSTPLLAFGFGSLAMLGWLAVAVAPILIHLWSKRKHHEEPWAAVEFLLAAMRKNARRIRLQNWLLLAVRMLIIVLVVLAMAEPFVERLGFSFAPFVRTHRMFVLDGSYSMAYRPTEVSLFGRAKRLIAEIVESSGQGDAFTLVLMGEPPIAIVRRPSFSKSDFLAELESVIQPNAGGDLTATLRIVEDTLHRVRKEQPALEHHEVCFLTDLGQTTWHVSNSQSSATNAPGVQSVDANDATWSRLAKLAKLSVVDVGLEDVQNLAVTDVTARKSFTVVGRDSTFEAVIRNFGTQPKSRCLVQFLINGVPVVDRHVDVPASAETTIRFVHRFDRAGSHTVGVRLGGDLLAVDNSRWLSILVKPNLCALCIEGKRNAARYIADALAPEPSSAALIQVQTVQESALAEIDLSEYDCVFLCNIAQLTAGEVEELDRFLERGGGIVFFLGDQVIPERINRATLGDTPLLPVKIGELAPESQYSFDPLDYHHPIVSPFRGREAAGLLSTPISRYYRLLQQKDSPQAEIALSFTSGDPAIVIAPVHRGKVAVVATAGSMASVAPSTGNPWTAWPAWPSFLPVVRGLLAETVGGRRASRNVRVGEPIGEVLSQSSGIDGGATQGTAVEVTRPDDTTHVVRMQTVHGQAEWTFDGTDRAGVYRAAFDNTQDSFAQFAVNVNTVESDLTKTRTSELPKQLAIHKTWTSTSEEEPVLLGMERQHHLHRGLLHLAIALMLVESFLAWKFGRGAL